MNWEDFEKRHKDREGRRRERTEQRSQHRAWRRRHPDAPKEKVLHTRISEQLSDDIRQVAEELRVPVSNLVRNVLEEAFSVVETVSENVGDLLEEILDETEDVRRRYRRRHARDAGADAETADDADDGDVADTLETGDDVDREARERPAFAEVLGWQPIVMNRETECADCGDGVAAGERAFMGITNSGLSSTVLCRDCTQARG